MQAVRECRLGQVPGAQIWVGRAVGGSEQHLCFLKSPKLEGGRGGWQRGPRGGWAGAPVQQDSQDAHAAQSPGSRSEPSAAVTGTYPR